MSIKTVFISIVLVISMSCKKTENAPLPIADFFVEILTCNSGVCEVKLVDNSKNSVSWEWKIEGEVHCSSNNCLVSLMNGQNYTVELKVNNSDGVEAVKVKTISI